MIGCTTYEAEADRILRGVHLRGFPLPAGGPAEQLPFIGFGATYRERLTVVERQRYALRRERARGGEP